MKRKIAITTALVFSLLTFMLQFNLQTNYAAQQSTNPINVLLNGDKLTFDVNPYIKGGRTLVPFRAILEALGAEVIWNPTERSVTAKGSKEIYLKIGDTATTVNGSKVLIDVPAEITGGRTFVPLRFVSENLGATVVWNGTTRTVSIDYKATSIVDPGDGEIPAGSGSNSNSGEVFNKIGEVISYEDSKIIISKTEFDSKNSKFIISGKIAYNGRRITIDVIDTDGYSSPAIIESIGNESGELKSFEVQKNIDYKNFVAAYLEISVVTENREKMKIGKIDLIQ